MPKCSGGKCLLQGCVSFLSVQFPHPAPCRAVPHGCSALVSFRRNLSLVKELGDRAAQGRAYGNLGNTQYLLGNFSEAIAFHKEVGATSAPSLGLAAAFLLPTAQQAQGGVSPSCFPPSCVKPRLCALLYQLTLSKSYSSPHQPLVSSLREGCCWLGNQRRYPRAHCSWVWQGFFFLLLICLSLDFNKCKP